MALPGRPVPALKAPHYRALCSFSAKAVAPKMSCHQHGGKGCSTPATEVTLFILNATALEDRGRPVVGKHKKDVVSKVWSPKTFKCCMDANRKFHLSDSMTTTAS